MFFTIDNKTIETALKTLTRQYLAGNLLRTQAIEHFQTEALEIGITDYKDYTSENPHTHSVATEYQYVINGWTKYLDLSTQQEYEFKTGDFFVITPGTVYAQKSKPGTKILFVKTPSINDKKLVDIDSNTARWLGERLQTVRTDYSYDSEAPETNSIKPAVAVAVVKDSCVLLVRRRDNRRWTLPGGTLEADESLSQCAIREIKEETGLTVELLDIVGIYSDPNIKISYSDGEVRREFTIVYLGELISGELEIDEESTDYAWASLYELDKYEIVDSQRRRLNDLSKYLKDKRKIMK